MDLGRGDVRMDVEDGSEHEKHLEGFGNCQRATVSRSLFSAGRQIALTSVFSC
jgi:hypothetical protein